MKLFCPLWQLANKLLLVVSIMAMTTSMNGESTEKTLEMVVTAHPLATMAGERILQAGGTAADAMVAIQAVLGLVEPQSSGLGGGAFALYYDAASSQLSTFDGRETAPAAATEDLFANSSGFFEAWQSGLSVGVPGVPRLLETIHTKYGSLPWDINLFQDAIDLATDGFEFSGRTEFWTNFLLGFNSESGFDCVNRFLWRDPTAFEYFVQIDEENTTLCSAIPEGTTQTNLAYAETLKLLAEEGGVDAFYSGAVAEAIVAAVQNDLAAPGEMTLPDLEKYKVVERPPVCLDSYKGNKQVCGMGPPSSGGLAVGQILGILEKMNMPVSDDPLSADAVHAFTQANRLAFADRNQYVGDPDFVSVPSEGMLDQAYLAERAALVNGTDMGMAAAGIPPGFETSLRQGADKRQKTTGTSHISIIDRCGNALSMTASIESPFGNGVMVNGFLLNNELTDFSFAAVDEAGNPIANRVGGGKRPRSSMSPTIIFDENGIPEALTGSPGGASIIGFTAQSIYAMYDFGLDPQSATELPHYQNNNADETQIELPIPNVTMDYDFETLIQDLEARGHVVSREGPMASGLGIILVDEEDGTLVGGADPRRDGTVGGTDMSDGSMDCDLGGGGSIPPTGEPTVESSSEGENPGGGDGEEDPVEDDVSNFFRVKAIASLVVGTTAFIGL